MVVCDVSKPWGTSIKNTMKTQKFQEETFHLSPLDRAHSREDSLIVIDDQPLGPEKARNKGGMDKGYAPYLRKDTFAPLTKTLKEILAMESGSQHQRLLLVKKENKGSCGFGKVGPSDERYPRDQSEEQKPRKKQCKCHKHDKGRRKSQEIF
ncbi:hypothetical protein Tco_0435869 [Tanacetum coccineum]